MLCNRVSVWDFKAQVQVFQLKEQECYDICMLYIYCIPTLNRNVHQSDRDSHTPTVPSTPRYPAPLLYCHRSQQVALFLGLKGEGCTTHQSGCFGNMKYMWISHESEYSSNLEGLCGPVQMWDQPFFLSSTSGVNNFHPSIQNFITNNAEELLPSHQ